MKPANQLRGSRRLEAMIWMSAQPISSGPPITTWPNAIQPSVTSKRKFEAFQSRSRQQTQIALVWLAASSAISTLKR